MCRQASGTSCALLCACPSPGEPDVSDVAFYRIFMGFSEVRVVVMWLRMFPPRTFDILSEILETLEVWESWPAVLEMCVLLYQLWPLLEFLEYYQPKALTCVLCLLVFPTQIADIPEMRVVGAEHMLIQSARWPCSSENAYWSMLLV